MSLVIAPRATLPIYFPEDMSDVSNASWTISFCLAIGLSFRKRHYVQVPSKRDRDHVLGFGPGVRDAPSRAGPAAVA